ncbi:hypothetical protein L228DRAFT_236396 [Xylona heveae TC161]|uniref:DNA-directed RNA polymerase III subunit RPC9 n=1 Tax=Xylona heveae (strain CBS 132557 / TC161) TaxID=1328760 RepID=A0A165IRI8_XYLHT|nr:hypothetical protein L228DRAFT_236396 [Xylona heveae TC161]KZF25281.1 hypothetical protein L228DRAFT_236396 [Xylona heveae TC161]
MKILETQSAPLTNYEVLTHLQSMRKRYDAEHSVKSGNLETVMKELTDYLTTTPSPLAGEHEYTDETIPKLMSALEPYDLTKAEMLMIFNIRPESQGVLDTIVEELDMRLDEKQQEEIVEHVARILGRAPEPEGEGEDAEGEEEEMEAVEGEEGGAAE